MDKKDLREIDKQIGSRLRTMRLERGISQHCLGSALGISFQQIQKYERGLNRMGASRIVQLSKFLGVSINDFFQDHTNAAINASTLNNRTIINLVRDLQKMPDGFISSLKKLIIQARIGGR